MSIRTIGRPKGYQYPIGLSTFDIIIASANAATNTTGGTQTIDGDNAVHTYTTSGFFEPSFTGDVELLMIAGGGSGGQDYMGGGGGAGGLVYSSSYPVTISANVTISIGSGGSFTYSPGIGALSIPGSPGSNTEISISAGSPTTNLVALYGGAGGSNNPSGPVKNGLPGGSGGGGAGSGDAYTPVPAVSTGGSGSNYPSPTQQGSPGGTGFQGGQPGTSFTYAGGGGGGAGAAGGNGVNGVGGGNGGAGLEYSISGSPVFYAGGGGAPYGTEGTSRSPGGNGGAGGGGYGISFVWPATSPDGFSPTAPVGASTNGTANRGGGGAGSARVPVPSNHQGGSGGSGVVIVRYQITQNVGGLDYTIN